MRNLGIAALTAFALMAPGTLSAAGECHEMPAGLQFCPGEPVIHTNVYGPGWIGFQFLQGDKISPPSVGIRMEPVAQGVSAFEHWAWDTVDTALIKDGLAEVKRNEAMELGGVRGTYMLVETYFLESYFVFQHRDHAVLVQMRGARGKDTPEEMLEALALGLEYLGLR